MINLDCANLRVDNENSTSFSQVKCHTTGLQAHQEDLDVGVIHEVVDASLPLNWRHACVQHDRIEAGMAQSPFNQLQHRRELAEDNALECLFLATQLVQVINEHLN